MFLYAACTAYIYLNSCPMDIWLPAFRERSYWYVVTIGQELGVLFYLGQSDLLSHDSTHFVLIMNVAGITCRGKTFCFRVRVCDTNAFILLQGDASTHNHSLIWPPTSALQQQSLLRCYGHCESYPCPLSPHPTNPSTNLIRCTCTYICVCIDYINH